MEKLRGIRKYRHTLLLAAAAAALTACGPSGGGKPASPAAESGSAGAAASQAEKNAQTTPSVDGIESIQAYTDGTIYGTGVVEVDVSYRDGVDLSGITPDSYILEDRGSLSPEFGTLRISGASVDGNTVKLMISNLPQATENNQLVYTGDGKTGARERNAFGIYCTGSWYRDESGDIHFGRTDTEHYKANTTGMGWQARHCLELKLRHAGEAEDKAVCLADEKGEYASGGLWKETVDRQFGEDGFQSIYDLKITSTGNNASDGTGDPYVRGFYYVPKNYDPAKGMVVVLQGQGISYWKLADGCDNNGTGIMYDTATVSWKNTGAIVLNIHDRSSALQGGYYEDYDFVLDDVNVMKYFIDSYKVTGPIVIQGNSRGTMASDAVIKALAGAHYNPKQQAAGWSGELDRRLDKTVYPFHISAYICQNGTFGGNIGKNGDPQFNDEAWDAVAKTELRVWCFDGEQDTNNIETTARYAEACRKAGRDESWINENIRLTGYPSALFYPWGESDHSVTRMNGWYFADSAYYGPDLTIAEDGTIKYRSTLKDGAFYTLQCLGAAGGSSKNGYRYRVYDSSFHLWALGQEKQPAAEESARTELTEENIPEVDRTLVNRLPLTGYLGQSIELEGGEKRHVSLYIGRNAPVRCYMTWVNIPDGEDSYSFLKESGWIDLMDRRREGVFALEPGDSGWKSAEEEQPYLEAALTAYNDRTWYSNYSTSYMAGYGKGGSALQAFAMAHPTGFISAVFADASDIPDDYISRTGMMTNDAQTDILKNAIPLPVWEINAGDAVKSYWLRANYCELSDGQAEGDATVFTQKASCLPTSYMKGVKAQVRLQSGEVPSRTPEFTEKAYAFMSAYTRYENIWANGNALLLRPDYEELGVEFKTLEDAEGYTREYMVYVPEAIRGSDRIPMVLLMAGNTQTDRVFFDSTAWWQVADDNGFMIVVPCEQYNTAANMTWNITGYQQGSKSAILDDVDFVKKVLEATERDYKVDTSRHYVSGQSFGSMWTNYCAVYMSDYFTAFGSTSGPISFAIDENAATTPVPVWLFAGEHDIFDWDFNKDVKEGFSLKNTVQYYLKRNGLGELADAVEESSGRYTTYTWSTADGVPAYRFTQTGGRNHNCIPSEARKIYEEWFSLWEKDENGKRLFNGAELK